MVDFPDSAPTRVRSATEVAGEMLRELIGSGALGPGDRLNVDELGHQLGVSRTPVRDALHQLRTEGLVDIQPRKGVFVRRITAQEVAEIYAIKEAVEPLAADWAARRATADQKARLEGLLAALRAAGDANDVPAAAASVEQIHVALFECAGSSVLSDVYQVFSGRARTLRQLNMAQEGRLTTSVRQHEEIVGLVLAGEAEAARSAMAGHMADAAQSAMRVAAEGDAG
ncbi:GntR family transcriptional regulator [Nocardioides sp. cx-173]|uniref:GntR family transcriptional regulator n=1 Tax=Nocardioides sp. cx-173 TaxID=2898796 RepID=UPI001E31285D|nr:GntR family transcriptional regulator [Nocardioides sp. cx-173]MCD4525266.1 GntR family transcriptional regulator [Nocardioides sp. cx-173]UGB40932.1 GntR family transcriptional regulator [Nocardioides sp. cx-173]